MIEKKAVIKNGQGIHCRPSALILQEVAAYDGKVRLECENGGSDLISVLDLMSLCLEQGTEVLVRVEGPDELAFCEKMISLFETHFDFPPQE